jgi:hypothetical protein
MDSIVAEIAKKCRMSEERYVRRLAAKRSTYRDFINALRAMLLLDPLYTETKHRINYKKSNDADL